MITHFEDRARTLDFQIDELITVRITVKMLICILIIKF